MPDFFDQLWEQMQDPRPERQKAQYIEKIKSFIATSPELRRMSSGSDRALYWGKHVLSSFDPQPNLRGQIPDILLYRVDRKGHYPAWFREAKAEDAARVFWRSDPVKDEGQVLETRAMGADAYCLEMEGFDQAQIQYLAEVGRDYEMPAILCCRREEELARALQIKDVDHIWLQDELCAPQLLELPLFRGKTLIFELSGESEAELFNAGPDFVLCLIVNDEHDPGDDRGDDE